jgi:ligand-binding sensor domain-containing protein
MPVGRRQTRPRAAYHGPVVRRVLRRSLVALLVLAWSSSGYALDASRTLTQYIHRIWQVQQGLPQASIYAIVQTRDGFLWLGTQTGLVKFDGVKFTTIDDIGGVSMSNLWVTQLVEDEQGALWIGTNHDGLLKLQHGVVVRYGEREGLPARTVQCVVADRHGVVWVCTPQGIASISNGRLRALGTAAGLTSPDVRAACMQSDGTLVAGTGDGRVAAWDGTRFKPRARIAADSAVQAMLCASDRSLWIGTSDGLIHDRDGRQDQFGRDDGLASASIVTLMESRDHAVYAGTKDGFSRIRETEIESFRPQDGLSQSSVYSVYEDREGSLWVATKHGLNQFLDGRAIPYTTSEGLPSNNTGPVLQDRQGSMWIGTLDAGLARFDGRRFETMTTRDGLASNVVSALAEERDGDLWVGTDAGINRVHRGRVVGTWTTRQGLPANAVHALFSDRDGTLWIATAAGAAVFRDGRIERIADPRRAPVGAIAAFGQDHGHGFFAAPDNDSPFLRHADAIYTDADGLLWIGTEGDGLRLVDGDRVFTFSVLDGLFDDVIYGIAGDDQGRLWMACSKGIFAVSRADLRQFAAGKVHSFVSTPYSPMDVLRTLECRSGVQPALARTADGQLWFSTIRGVLVIDPSHMDRRFSPPSVAVEEATVDGERRPVADIGDLPPGRNNVSFSYTGVSFVAPSRITFRYKLDGFDSTWVDAGSRRQAFYTNLPPGKFRFRVAACNPDDACDVMPNAVVFTIEPRVYQRAWFIPLCVALLALGAWGVLRLRIRRLNEHFDLILAERGRIARELHDTLIQGFAGITMGMQAVASRLPFSPERRALEDIVGDAGTSLREARRSLSGLRSADADSGLAAALARTARQVTAGHELRLKLDLDPGRRTLSADVEDNLLRIAREAVLNAVKHSNARTLQVSLDETPQQLRLSVRDDGTGFDENGASPDGHYGLVGMRERAAQIGAAFRLTSTPGRGTTVSVTMES